jgi:hypothetical protein
LIRVDPSNAPLHVDLVLFQLVTLDSRNPVIKLNCAIALRCGGSSANQTSN